jgi:DNA-directed RNA polymerase specialized sigma24 family protein
MQSPLSETPANPSDEQLVSLAQGGDRRALEQLVARHGPWIFNVAARMVWRRDDAADVTQEVLVKAITKLSTFRGESAFRTWLYRIVVNHVINLKKSSPSKARCDPSRSSVAISMKRATPPPPTSPEECPVGCS